MTFWPLVEFSKNNLGSKIWLFGFITSKIVFWINSKFVLLYLDSVLSIYSQVAKSIILMILFHWSFPPIVQCFHFLGSFFLSDFHSRQYFSYLNVIKARNIYSFSLFHHFLLFSVSCWFFEIKLWVD